MDNLYLDDVGSHCCVLNLPLGRLNVMLFVRQVMEIASLNIDREISAAFFLAAFLKTKS